MTKLFSILSFLFLSFGIVSASACHKKDHSCNKKNKAEKHMKNKDTTKKGEKEVTPTQEEMNVVE